jgi:membrane protein
MNKKIKFSVDLLKLLIKDFSEDRVMRMSASLAYYTVFSLPGLLFLLIGLCGIFLGKDAIEGKIFSELSAYMGEGAAETIESTIEQITLKGDNLLYTAIGAITLLLSATSIFGEVQDAINVIWGLKANPRKKGWVKLIIDRLLSFSMLFILGFIFMVALIINTLMDLLITYFSSYFSFSLAWGVYIIDYLFTFGVITFLFVFIYKYLPDSRLGWKDVVPGAVAAAVLFMLGKAGLGFYLSGNKTVSLYGVAGHIILLLLWVYYSALILYAGAEFTQAYYKMKGKPILPSAFAVSIEKNPLVHKEEQKEEHVTENPDDGKK